MRESTERDLAVADELGLMADARIKELEAENTALREQLARLQSDYAALQQINDAAERERQAAESQLAQVTQEWERLRRYV